MQILKWKTTKEDYALIAEIAKRASDIAAEHHVGISGGVLLMDVTACHLNGCQLKLQELLDAPKFDFTHDVFGIHRHINRDTGALEDCFLPRFAA